MKNGIFLMLFFFILSSCKSKKVYTENTNVIETAATIPTEISTAEMISRGESLFLNKCGNCHDLPKVKDHSPENWKPIMLRMQKAADLSDTEREYVYKYIVMQ